MTENDRSLSLLVMTDLQHANTEHIIANAVSYFWRHGYSGTSMSSLVTEVGVNRKAIYASFNGKDDLFIACLKWYKDNIVTPAFQQVEAYGADLTNIEHYFRDQINLAEEFGFPGIGCLFGNTMTEIAPHNSTIQQLVLAHNKRLESGFLNALNGEISGSSEKISSEDLSEIATLISCIAQGIWSYSRVANNANELRSKAKTLIGLVRARINTRVLVK